MTAGREAKRIRVGAPRRAWLWPAALGTAAGLLLGWALGHQTGPQSPRAVSRGASGESGPPPWRERISGGVEAAAESLREIGARFVRAPPPDPDALHQSLVGVAGTKGIKASDLGDGIVELTGSASDRVTRAAAVAVAAVPGVRAVVNRVWTPSSASPKGN